MTKSDILVKSDLTMIEKNHENRCKTRFCSVNTYFSWQKLQIFVKNGGHASPKFAKNWKKWGKNNVSERKNTKNTHKIAGNRSKTYIFTKKSRKNTVFFREFSKTLAFFQYLRNKTLFFGIAAWVPPGTPSIAPRGDHEKMINFSTLLKNETGTKPSFNRKVITKEKSVSPPPPPSGL